MTADTQRLVDKRLRADRVSKRAPVASIGAAQHDLLEAADFAAEGSEFCELVEERLERLDGPLVAGLKHRDGAVDHDRGELALAGIQR